MEYHFHSNYMSNIKIHIPENIDYSKLNHYEIIGLYLMGGIDFNELVKVMQVQPYMMRQYINNIMNTIDESNENEFLYNNMISMDIRDKKDYGK